MEQATITITDPIGLHARPAALLVRTVGQYQAQVRLEYGSKRASARSILQLLSLGVRLGSEVTVIAEGIDAVDALAAALAVLTAVPEAPESPVAAGEL